MNYALVNSVIAPVMKETNFECSLEDEVLYGMKVELLKKEKDWYRIKTHYRYEGFVHERYLLVDEVRKNVFEHLKKKIVIHSYADVLSMPKYQGANVISLIRGAQVGILTEADENGWVKVQLLDGLTGYMKEKFLCTYEDSMYQDTFYEMNIDGKKEQITTPLEYIEKILKKSEKDFRDDLVNTAMMYLGTQYRWGGKTSLGIDCSGLCSMSYMLNGLVIYRDARIQEGFPIKEIPFENKKKGDLLFFPGHVAMYIGDGQYIHSTGKNGSDGVVMNSLNPEDSNYREDLPKLLTATGSVF